MKAEELCIGDWVEFPHCIDRIVDLPYIRGNGLCASFAASATLFTVPIEQLKPIPLTQEILEKNGFKFDGSGQRSMMLISTPHFSEGIRYNIYVGLKKKTIEVFSAHPEEKSPNWRKSNKVYLEVCGCYVHELQRALRLCNIDKEMVL